MPLLFVLALTVGFVACATGPKLPPDAPKAPGPVGATRVVASDGRFQLWRDGQPYFVRGAAGTRYLDELVAAGGNSFRTWGTDDAERLLDAAQARGLSVMLGISLGKARQGFDYHDEASRKAQRDRVIETVKRYREHPALLMWALGNEVELNGDVETALPAIDELARLIHELDPHHPVTTVLAGADAQKIRAFVQHCPNIDVLSINAFGTAELVPAGLEVGGYEGPYLITELGVRGWWETRMTVWGAPIEATSAEKAEMFERAYARAVAGQPDRCLGSYAFLWGDKQEATATWFGMFLPDGSKTAAVDWATRTWSGKEAADRAPLVRRLQLRPASGRVAPGGELTAMVVAEDPDGDPLSYEWTIVWESNDRREGGDRESVPPDAEGRVAPGATANEAVVTAPPQPGAYRLFVTVRDPAGNAGTANLPFQVLATP